MRKQETLTPKDLEKDLPSFMKEKISKFLGYSKKNKHEIKKVYKKVVYIKDVAERDESRETTGSKLSYIKIKLFGIEREIDYDDLLIALLSEDRFQEYKHRFDPFVFKAIEKIHKESKEVSPIQKNTENSLFEQEEAVFYYSSTNKNPKEQFHFNEDSFSFIISHKEFKRILSLAKNKFRLPVKDTNYYSAFSDDNNKKYSHRILTESGRHCVFIDMKRWQKNMSSIKKLQGVENLKEVIDFIVNEANIHRITNFEGVL